MCTMTHRPYGGVHRCLCRRSKDMLQPAKRAQDLSKRSIEETIGANHREDSEHDIADSAKQHRCARHSSDEGIESAQKHDKTDEEEGDGWKDPGVRAAGRVAVRAQASSWPSGLVPASAGKLTCAEYGSLVTFYGMRSCM